MRRYHDFLEKIRDSIFVEDQLPEQADIIFVPGNGYPHMAQKAAELYQEGRSARILPSGKYSVTVGAFEKAGQECDVYGTGFETEWQFLQRVLLYHGVPEEAILREEQATYTYENAAFSRKVTEQAGISVKKAILCCKNYHAGRALMYYQLLYPETEFYVAPVSVDGITKENWAETEKGIEEVTEEVKRIFCQFSLLMKLK